MKHTTKWKHVDTIIALLLAIMMVSSLALPPFAQAQKKETIYLRHFGPSSPPFRDRPGGWKQSGRPTDPIDARALDAVWSPD